MMSEGRRAANRPPDRAIDAHQIRYLFRRKLRSHSRPMHLAKMQLASEPRRRVGARMMTVIPCGKAAIARAKITREDNRLVY